MAKSLPIVWYGLTSHSTQYRSFRRRVWRYLHSFRYNTRTSRTDERQTGPTDGQKWWNNDALCMPVFVSSRPRAFLLINEEMLLRATGIYLSHSSMCELAAAMLELLNTNTYQRDMRIIVMQIIIHAEHVVHRRGYCFHFGCMFVCMFVCMLPL